MIKHRGSFLDSVIEQPVGDLEASVARIEARVLRVDQFGRSDSFFDFGGTSLDAITICTLIETETGYRVPPHWVFESDVLADLVRRIASDAERIDAGPA
jgi:acyl carrier protein